MYSCTLYNNGSPGYREHYERDIKFAVVPDINSEDPLIWSGIDPFPLEQVDLTTFCDLIDLVGGEVSMVRVNCRQWA